MIRRLLRCFVASLAVAFAVPASASTISSPDFTDMWWAGAAEDGWGINIVQQADIIFATWFVYAPNRAPKWYVASGMQKKDAPTGWLFEGKLYETDGPWFGGVYAPAVGIQEVGDATLSFGSDSSATLVYNVGTTTVSKLVTRYFFRAVTPVGNYYPGGLTATRSGCSDSNLNGPSYTNGVLRVTLNSNQSVTFTIRDIINGPAGAYCEFTGNLGANGRYLSVNSGTWRCIVNGAAVAQGNFTMSMLDIQQNGLSASFTGNDASCQFSGRFGGLRDVQ